MDKPFDLAASQERLRSMLAFSEAQTRAVLEKQAEDFYGPNWREIIRAETDERELHAAVSTLYRMNPDPGKHIITIPADPNGKWTYTWEPE